MSVTRLSNLLNQDIITLEPVGLIYFIILGVWEKIWISLFNKILLYTHKVKLWKGMIITYGGIGFSVI